MNEHAGLSCVLSVLVVFIFAILLHDRQPPPDPSISKSDSTVRIESTSPITGLSPSLPPQASFDRKLDQPPRPDEVAWHTAVEMPQASTPVKSPVTTPIETGFAQVPPQPLIASSAWVPPTPQKSLHDPAGSFVEVSEGESLAIVADRVYGSPAAAERLWKANRDQLGRLDAPLTRGMLLRTP